MESKHHCSRQESKPPKESAMQKQVTQMKRRGIVAKNVITRMEDCCYGPLSILYKSMAQRLLIKVWTRSYRHVRGICTGYLVAFDKHQNLAMVDVDEVYKLPEELTRKKPRKRGGKNLRKNRNVQQQNPVNLEENTEKSDLHAARNDENACTETKQKPLTSDSNTEENGIEDFKTNTSEHSSQPSEIVNKELCHEKGIESSLKIVLSKLPEASSPAKASASNKEVKDGESEKYSSEDAESSDADEYSQANINAELEEPSSRCSSALSYASNSVSINSENMLIMDDLSGSDSSGSTTEDEELNMLEQKLSELNSKLHISSSSEESSSAATDFETEFEITLTEKMDLGEEDDGDETQTSVNSEDNISDLKKVKQSSSMEEGEARTSSSDDHRKKDKKGHVSGTESKTEKPNSSSRHRTPSQEIKRRKSKSPRGRTIRSVCVRKDGNKCERSSERVKRNTSRHDSDGRSSSRNRRGSSDRNKRSTYSSDDRERDKSRSSRERYSEKGKSESRSHRNDQDRSRERCDGRSERRSDREKERQSSRDKESTKTTIERDKSDRRYQGSRNRDNPTREDGSKRSRDDSRERNRLERYDSSRNKGKSSEKHGKDDKYRDGADRRRDRNDRESERRRRDERDRYPRDDKRRETSSRRTYSSRRDEERRNLRDNRNRQRSKERKSSSERRNLSSKSNKKDEKDIDIQKKQTETILGKTDKDFLKSDEEGIERLDTKLEDRQIDTEFKISGSIADQIKRCRSVVSGYATRHISQLFIRGDNVVMVAIVDNPD